MGSSAPGEFNGQTPQFARLSAPREFRRGRARESRPGDRALAPRRLRALDRKGELCDVGLANNLRSRLGHHLKDQHRRALAPLQRLLADRLAADEGFRVARHSNRAAERRQVQGQVRGIGGPASQTDVQRESSLQEGAGAAHGPRREACGAGARGGEGRRGREVHHESHVPEGSLQGRALLGAKPQRRAHSLQRSARQVALGCRPGDPQEADRWLDLLELRTRARAVAKDHDLQVASADFQRAITEAEGAPNPIGSPDSAPDSAKCSALSARRECSRRDTSFENAGK